jgi:hypothetical protein
MRAHELIRTVLDLIDQFDQPEIEPKVEISISNPNPPADENHFKQIADLMQKTETEYSNSPNAQYAGIEAVTTHAGGGVNGPKHPADIRADSMSMYPGKVYGAR